MLINLATFQLKLVADGLRDLLLFPLAVVTIVYGVLFSSDEPDYYFKKLLAFGRRSDRFINLFNQNDIETEDDTQDLSLTTADELLAPYQKQIEERLVTRFSKPDSDPTPRP